MEIVFVHIATSYNKIESYYQIHENCHRIIIATDDRSYNIIYPPQTL